MKHNEIIEYYLSDIKIIKKFNPLLSNHILRGTELWYKDINKIIKNLNLILKNCSLNIRLYSDTYPSSIKNKSYIGKLYYYENGIVCGFMRYTNGEIFEIILTNENPKLFQMRIFSNNSLNIKIIYI